ncbi:MAG TPA: hypothetical protein VFQ43_20445 [Nitrososphaera sp.]|nr:hypothetical protein [Nitrososphaera sp.]
MTPRGSGRTLREAAEIQWSEWDERPTYADATAWQGIEHVAMGNRAGGRQRRSEPDWH